MDYVCGHTEDEGTIACLAVQREGLEREGSKRVQQVLEVVHSLL